MSFRILLLVAVIFGSPNVKGYEPCEYAHLMKCNEVFVAGFKTHRNDPDVQVYCSAYQHFADCLSSSSQCKGEFIDTHRYIILQRMIMDKTLNLCPQHDLQAFTEVVRVYQKNRLHIEHLSGVDKDKFAPCAAEVHRKCATQLAQEMKNGVKLCTGVKDFIECYANPRGSCSAKIYQHFINLLRKFALRILKMYKESPSVVSDCENFDFKL